MAERYQDGIGRWLYEETLIEPERIATYAPGQVGVKLMHGWISTLLIPILFYNDNAPLTIPEAVLPLDKIYKTDGFVFYRSGWGDPQDMFFGIECYPAWRGNIVPARHDRVDKGSFVINAYGKNFIFDSGNPQRYNSNICLINVQLPATGPLDLGEAYGGGWRPNDGDIREYFSNENYGFTYAFTKSAYDTLYQPAGQDLTILHSGNFDPNDMNEDFYINPVESADRYYWYIKEQNGLPFYFVITDDIQKDQDPNTYTLKLWSNAGVIDIQDNPIQIGTGSAYMNLW